MSAYAEKVQTRDQRPSRAPLPPVGSWVATPRGFEGQVVEHLQHPGRGPMARVRFRDRYGWFRPTEIRDIGSPAS